MRNRISESFALFDEGKKGWLSRSDLKCAVASLIGHKPTKARGPTQDHEQRLTCFAHCYLVVVDRAYLTLLVVDSGGLQAELEGIFGTARADEGVLRADFLKCMEALLHGRAGTDDDRIRQVFKAFDLRCERCTTPEPSSCPRGQPSLLPCRWLSPPDFLFPA